MFWWTRVAEVVRTADSGQRTSLPCHYYFSWNRSSVLAVASAIPMLCSLVSSAICFRSITPIILNGSEHYRTILSSVPLRLSPFRIIRIQFLVRFAWGPLSLVTTIEELLGRNSISGLESEDYGRGDSSRWPRGTLYPQKLALISPTSCGSSVGILHSRTQATEFRSKICIFHPRLEEASL
jgi:hypothetical protein